VTWTRKEAFIKALGLGFSFPLDAFCTGCQDRPPRLTQGGAVCSDWTIADLAPVRGYKAAVAGMSRCSVGKPVGRGYSRGAESGQRLLQIHEIVRWHRERELGLDVDGKACNWGVFRTPLCALHDGAWQSNLAALVRFARKYPL
jgi:hypothetical protein